MALRDKLERLARLVAAQAERDPDFAAALTAIFAPQPAPAPRAKKPAAPRRQAAVLDPVALAREGEDALRARLAPLDLERLRDIVAEHRMDPSRKVMKWKTASRVSDEIVALSLMRARKGDGFRDDAAAPPSPPVA